MSKRSRRILIVVVAVMVVSALPVTEGVGDVTVTGDLYDSLLYPLVTGSVTLTATPDGHLEGDVHLWGDPDGRSWTYAIDVRQDLGGGDFPRIGSGSLTAVDGVGDGHLTGQLVSTPGSSDASVWVFLLLWSGDPINWSEHLAYDLRIPVGATNALISLAQDVAAIDLANGIEVSLDAKLDAALRALESEVEADDVAAVNALEAFVNATEAQGGKHIPVEEAEYLIGQALAIIAMIAGP